MTGQSTSISRLCFNPSHLGMDESKGKQIMIYCKYILTCKMFHLHCDAESVIQIDNVQNNKQHFGGMLFPNLIHNYNHY